MPLDRQVKVFLAMVEAAGLPKLNECTPAEARAQTAKLRELVGAGPEVDTVDDFSLPTSAGAIPARRYEPAAPRPRCSGCTEAAG